MSSDRRYSTLGHAHDGSDINVQNASYTCVRSDAGKTISKESGGAGETITIPANNSVPYDIGTLIAISNDGGGDLTIALTSDTLEGTDGSTGSRTLTNNNVALLQKLTATKWRYASSESSASASTPEYASFYNSTAGNTAVATTETRATLNATLVNSDSGIFSLATNVVTVNKTADYKITYDMTIQQGDDGTHARSTLWCWIDVDSVEVSGSRAGNYTRGYGTHTGLSGCLITSLTSGEAVTLQWQADAGDDFDEVANTIRLTLEEMV